MFTDNDLAWLLGHGAMLGRMGCFEIRLKGATFRTFPEQPSKPMRCGAYIGVADAFFGYGATAEECVRNAIAEYEKAMEQKMVKSFTKERQEKILSEIKEIVNYKEEDEDQILQSK